MELKAERTGDGTAEIYIYGDIVPDASYKCSSDDVVPKEIVEKLREAEGADTDIYINSAGGSVFAGFAIYNAIRQMKGHKTVYIDGLAASIASVIAMAGDEIIVYPDSYMMIHKAWTCIAGNADDLMKTATELERLDKSISEIYRSRYSGDAVELEGMIRAETWLSGEECALLFGAKLVRGIKAAAYAHTEYSYRNMPGAVRVHDTGGAREEKGKAEIERLKILLA